MEITQFQHPDSVWTWKSSKGSSRASLWLPYFQGVSKVKGTTYRFEYNGGEVDADLKQVDFIMLYGASGALPVDFLDALNSHRICLSIHRRNKAKPYIFAPTSGADDIDVLSAQIKFRNNFKKRCYIARVLLRARFQSMAWKAPIPSAVLKRLAQERTLNALRSLEANTTRRYWSCFYGSLGVNVNRRETDPVNQALNAGSMFLSGIILRWVLFHKLSPQHGYLHVPSSYPSLVYDLMEPYRYIFERAVAQSYGRVDPEKEITPKTIATIKHLMEEEVYVPATRQTVRRKNLLHGCVMSLRSYLIGESRRLVIPQEGAKKGGRPPKLGYQIPGGIVRCD